MAARSTPIQYYKGDGYTKQITLKDEVTEAAIDLTGYTVTVEVYAVKEPTVESPLFTLSGTITDDVNGVFTVTPTTAQNDITRADYYYMAILTLGATKRTVARNKWKII